MLRDLESRRYKLKGKQFSVKFKKGEDSEEDECSNKLNITNIPDGVDEGYLKIELSDCLDMDIEEDAEMQFFGHHCTLTFKQSYSAPGMCKIIHKVREKLQREKKLLHTFLCIVCIHLHVQWNLELWTTLGLT